MNKTNLWIYGSLKKGQSRASVMEGQEFVGEFNTTPDYRMFNMGSFPALKNYKDNGNRIKGELWRVDDRCLQILNRIEGAPSFYRLEEINLENVENKDKIYSYFYQHDISGLPDCGCEWL